MSAQNEQPQPTEVNISTSIQTPETDDQMTDIDARLQAINDKIEQGASADTDSGSDGDNQNQPSPKPNEDPSQELDSEGEAPINPEDLNAQHTEANEAMAEVLNEKGIDFSKLQKEYTENNGTLTEATQQKLVEAGYPVEAQQAFIKGQEAIANQAVGALYDTVGGRENYDNIIQWYNGVATEQEKRDVVNLYESGNISSIKLVLGSLKSRYEGETQKVSKPVSISQNSTPRVGAQTNAGYNSRAEYQEAMMSTDYDSSQVYRDKVTAKMKASDPNIIFAKKE